MDGCDMCDALILDDGGYRVKLLQGKEILLCSKECIEDAVCETHKNIMTEKGNLSILEQLRVKIMNGDNND